MSKTTANAMQVDSSKPKIDVPQFLATLSSSSPNSLHPLYERFQNLYNRKLWHQLTNTLFTFFALPDSKKYRIDVFTSFVRDFEAKLNPLRLAEMAVIVAREFDNPQRHLEFLTELLERIGTEKEKKEAGALLLATLAHAKLLYGDMAGTKVDMDKCSKMLDDLDSVEPSVNAAYYNVAADYYKVKPAYTPYYRHALLYLACLPDPIPLTHEEKLGRAHDLALAALLGEEIYNFGELLMHPILDSLDNTPHDWLKKLLITFNEGDIGKFESLSPLFGKESLLQQNYTFLRQKICLMALIESVFKRMGSSSESKVLSFQTIAEETRLPMEEVEHLVMKALSLKLIRGSIDQVSALATITWVQPRVLSRPQIGILARRLTEWCEKLNGVEKFVNGETPELFVGA